MHKTYLVLLVILILGCRGANHSNSETNLETMVAEYIGSEYDRIDQGELALFATKPEVTGSEWKTFLVFDKTTKDVLYGPERLNAKISWKEPRVLKVIEQPEIIADKQSTKPTIYFLNVDTGRTYTPTPNK